MEKKLRKYINRKFFLYPKTDKIIEVREELFSIMLDRYRDCLAGGASKGESFKNAVEMTLGYREAVKEVETGSSMGAWKKNLVGVASFSTFYFLLLTAVYLFYSMWIVKSFQKTWLIPVGGAFLYLLLSALNTYQYARLFNFTALKRWSTAIVFASFIPVFFVFPSLLAAVVYSKSIWGRSWLVSPAILLVYLVVDYYINKKAMSTLERDLRLLAAGLIFTTLLYLMVSMRYNLWGSAWILYVLYLAFVSLAFYITEKMGRSG